MHGFGHLDLLYPKDQMTPTKALAIATKGETYEYAEMHPHLRHLAVKEGNSVAEFDRQIEASKVHAAAFKRTLEIAARRFAALTKVEEGHANQ